MSNNLDSSAPIDTDSGNSYSYSNSYGDVVDTRTSFSESFSYNVNGNSISYPIYGSTDDNDVNRSSYSNSNNDGNSNSDGNSSKTFSIVVNYYDKKDTRDKERTTIKQLTEQTTTREIVHLVANRISLAPDDRKYYSLVIIITNYNELKRLNVHYLRTLKDDEVLTIVENNMKSYISELLGYDMNDQELVSSKLVIRFYYKDCRTAPIDLKDYGVVVCGDPAFMEDDEEVISHSDLAYLGKGNKKGYLLKRSSKDDNLWLRRYCVLTENLWCVDISTDIPKATCVKVLGMMRERTISNNPDPLKVITIYSSNRTHYFRAFDVKEQEKWMADLTANTIFAADNEVINIADVIACDEEKSRVNRMHAVIKQLFETPLVSEKLLEVANADECYQPITISQGNKINGDNIANRSDDELSGSLNPQLSALMLANKNGSSRTSLGRDLISAQNSKSLSCQLPKYGMLAPEDLYLLDVTNSSLSPSKMSLMTKFHFPATSERNTSSVTDLLHSIHINDSTLTEMITFVADVQRYKELFRFRSVSSYKKKQAAFIIYINYIIPQLKLADLDSGRQRTFTNNSNFSTSMRFNDNELNSNARERFLSVGNRDETGPFNGDKVRFKYYRKYIASNRRINNKLNSMKSSLLADQDSSMNDRKVDVWLGISKDSLMKIFRSLLDEEDDTIDCTRKDSDSSIGNFSSATNSKETSSGKIGGSSAKLENSSNVKTTEFPSETIRPALKLSNVDSDEEVVGMRDVVTPINGNGTSSDIEQSNSVKIGVIRNDINDMITANQITPENKGSFSFRPRLLSGASLTGDPRAPIDTNSSANVDSKEPASSTSSGFWFLGGNRNASVKSKAESNNPKAADSQLARMASWNDEDSINTENIVNDMKEPSPFLFDEAVSDIMKVCNDSV